jgi:uncharacterized protein YpuA (DUF1002 family)
MFGFFKKPPTVKETIELKHKNGDVVKITIEGSNMYQVDYMSKRIKSLFEFSKRVDDIPDADFEKVFEDMTKVFEDAEKVMRKTFGKDK